MKRMAFIILLPLLALFTSGCMEQTMLITVKPDGSGTMRLRMFMSDQIAGGMAMAGAMGQEMAGALGEASGESAPAAAAGPSATDLINQLKKTLEDHKDDIGEGVEFVEGKEVANQKGWKGYEAVYRFKDINKITAGAVEQKSSGEEGGMAGSSSMSMGGIADFSFKFTPGSPARLEIIAQDEKGNKIADLEEAPAEPEDPMAAQMAAGMMSMMKPMLAGMRMTSIIKIDGEVVNTNAKYRGEKNQNAIILYDIDLDKVFSHPDGMKLLSTKDPAKAAAMNLPGMRMQNLKEPVFMEFK